MITLKSPREITLMRQTGKVVAEALELARRMVAPGVRTIDIDHAVEELFKKHGVTPLFKGYPGKVPFPGVICISINEEVVHGIPDQRVIREGSIVSIDTGCKLNGWCCDSAITLIVGDVAPEVRRLVLVTQQALHLAIREMGRHQWWSQVAAKIEDLVYRHGFSLVEKYVGHGIGREMHEDPQVPNFVSPQLLKNDIWLEEGLVLAIEPMVNLGTKHTRSLPDHWTVITRDRKPSAHFEHTVALTAEGPLILTAPEGQERIAAADKNRCATGAG